MNTDKDKVIEKIKKLLRMKRGGTQGEIENALAMAAKLAREHDIDIASVNPDEEKQQIGHEADVMGLSIPLEAKHAANICVRFFNVQICIDLASRHYRINGCITFVGTAWDIKVARYVFVFLQRCFRRAWANRENKRLKNREAFFFGMALGIVSKLEIQKPVGEGLIHIDRALQLRKNYLKNLFPDSETLPMDHHSDASGSKLAGYMAGQKTEIRSGLEKGKPERAALPAAQL